MAELNKKLHFLKNGTEKQAKAYSTTTEVNGDYITNKIDGVSAYIAIGETSDVRATTGRVIKNGETKAVLTEGKPVYTETSYTTAGTYSFTVPGGVTRVRVAMAGGGAGYACCVAGHSGWLDDMYAIQGTAGGSSSFGSLMSVTGGTGGACGTSCSRTAGAGGSPNGNAGTANGGYKVATTVKGGSGFSLSFTKTLDETGYGSGGGCYFDAHSGDQYSGNAGGGSGGYDSKYLDVEPGKTYSIQVGASGTGAYLNKGAYSSTVAKNITGMKSGFVLIGYGGDI